MTKNLKKSIGRWLFCVLAVLSGVHSAHAQGGWVNMGSSANGSGLWVWQWDPACEGTSSGGSTGSAYCPTTQGSLWWAVCSGLMTGTACQLPASPATAPAGNSGVVLVSTDNSGKSQALSRFIATTGTCSTGNASSCSFTITAMANGTANLQTQLNWAFYTTNSSSGFDPNVDTTLGPDYELQGWDTNYNSSPTFGGVAPTSVSIQYRPINGATPGSWSTTNLPLSITANKPYNLPGTSVYVWGNCAGPYYQCAYTFLEPSTVKPKPWDGGCQSSGDPLNPDCTGFTVSQFEQLDLSKMDLSQWLATLTPNQPSAAGLDSTAQSNAQAQGTQMRSSQNPAPLDVSGMGNTALKLSTSNCQVGSSTCTVTATATSNWPTTSTDANANTAPVQSVQLNWGDGSAAVAMSTTTGSDGRTWFTASHTYGANSAGTYPANYTAQANFSLYQPFASSTSGPAPVQGMDTLKSNIDYYNYTFPTLHLHAPNTAPNFGDGGYQLGKGNCASHTWNTTFTLSQQDLNNLGSFSLATVNWDDWVAIFVNGTIVMGGPYGGTTQVVQSGDSVIYNSAGSSANCEQGQWWGWSTGADLRPYLKVGSNTIQIQFAVGNIGAFDATFNVTSQPYCNASASGGSLCGTQAFFEQHIARTGFQVWQDNPPVDQSQQEPNGGGVFTSQ